MKKIVAILFIFWFFNPSDIAHAIGDPIGPWTSERSLPYPLANHSSIGFKNKLYIITGSAVSNDSHNEVFSSEPDHAGVLPQWSNLNNYPLTTMWNAVAANSSYLYVLGGLEEYPGQRFSDDLVSFTSGSSNSNWIQTTLLPKRLSKGAAAISGDYAYFAGGWTDSENVSTASNKVYYSHINPDGTLGTWNATTNLPGVMWDHRMVEHNGFLYIAGGWRDGTRTSDVIRAQVNADGTLSTWEYQSPLPDALENFGMAIFENTIITAGGGSNNGLTKKVYYSEIEPNGTVSNWQTSASDLVFPHCCGSLANVDGFLYLAGGYDGDYSLGVYKSQIKAPPPSPTPSPTPTPTLVQTKKVLLIPGTGASWNSDALLNCKDSGYSGNWTMSPFATSVYTDLASSLENSGYQVVPYYYDWRKQVTSHNTEIESIITSNLSTNEKIHVVGHSMGGLVSRSYLQTKTYESHFDKMLAVGSPFQGSPLAYPAWSAGETNYKNDLMFRIGTSILAYRCGSVGLNARTVIQQHMPFIQNLLPTFDYLENTQNHSLKSVLSMFAQNNWLPNEFNPPFFGVTVGTLSGNGKQTVNKIKVQKPNKLDNLLGNWKDGRLTQYLTTNSGDGVVLSSSSSLPGANNMIINKTHSGLVNTPEGIDKIIQFLEPINNLRTLSSLSNLKPEKKIEEPDSALLIMSDTDEFSIIVDNKEIRSQDRIISFINPKRKLINLRNIKQKSGNIIVAQFLANGKTLWKEYPARDHYNKKAKIDFEPDGHRDDIIKWE